MIIGGSEHRDTVASSSRGNSRWNLNAWVQCDLSLGTEEITPVRTEHLSPWFHLENSTNRSRGILYARFLQEQWWQRQELLPSSRKTGEKRRWCLLAMGPSVEEEKITFQQDCFLSQHWTGGKRGCFVRRLDLMFPKGHLMEVWGTSVSTALIYQSAPFISTYLIMQV